MKILLYFEGRNILSKSGIQRAYINQKTALEKAGFEVTTDRKSQDYDVLHLNTYGLSSLNLAHKAKKEGKKIVIYAHSTEEDFRNSFVGSNSLAPAYKNYLVKLYKMADTIIAPSDYTKKLLQGYGIKRSIFVISNGVDLPEYAKNVLKEEAFQKVFNIKENEKIVISAGGYFERKGIIDFVKLAKELPEYRFIWFGGRTPSALIPPHIRKIVRKSHPKNVEFSGYIKGDILEGAFSFADCFFFPSHEEREGIVVLEALASKQKVLLRDIEVYEGWLTNGVNCFKGKNNHEFKEKLIELVENPYEDLKRNAFATARERSIPEISKKFIEVYHTLK